MPRTRPVQHAPYYVPGADPNASPSGGSAPGSGDRHAAGASNGGGAEPDNCCNDGPSHGGNAAPSTAGAPAPPHDGAPTPASGGTPAPGNAGAPAPGNGGAPTPGNSGGAPASAANGATPAPANGGTPAPANGGTPAPANGGTPAPAPGVVTPLPTNGNTPAPNNGPAPTPGTGGQDTPGSIPLSLPAGQTLSPLNSGQSQCDPNSSNCIACDTHYSLASFAQNGLGCAGNDLGRLSRAQQAFNYMVVSTGSADNCYKVATVAGPTGAAVQAVVLDINGGSADVSWPLFQAMGGQFCGGNRIPVTITFTGQVFQ
ncbi:Expansin-like EG45 domain-containing protein [Plasmodiophora brassicae]|uniref:Uncharacterized protein n=1 Tax=Plasmodiophora brassicae TaxID=37360 RepID=A0A0G4IW46_PLABS|nr:hypothetical protein PBRA_001260 [Plasmodiophora brassicae]